MYIVILVLVESCRSVIICKITDYWCRACYICYDRVNHYKSYL